MAALAEYNKNPIGEIRDITLREIYEKWSEKEYNILDRSTANGYRAVWKRLEVLADEQVRAIKTSHLQDIIEGMIKEGLSRSSLEKAKTLCGILFEIAKNDDIIDTNYARAIKLPKSRKAKKETFTDLDIAMLERAVSAGDIWAGTILILIYTGLRISELLKLTRFNIDLQLRVISGGVKTDAGKDRIVPIHPKIWQYVQYWYDSKGPRLIHRDGQAISVDYYRKSLFYPSLERAGIKRHLTPHATRHTFGTLLSRANANTKHIQDLMGHTDYALTANVYTHPHIEELRNAIESI
jgi:integrase